MLWNLNMWRYMWSAYFNIQIKTPENEEVVYLQLNKDWKWIVDIECLLSVVYKSIRTNIQYIGHWTLQINNKYRTA